MTCPSIRLVLAGLAAAALAACSSTAKKDSPPAPAQAPAATAAQSTAAKPATPLEMARVGDYAWEDYWDPVMKEEGDRIILAPERFYLLLSEEAVRIPPEYAAEMTAYDPTSGELRTHYAGFFDPGFGHAEAGGAGARAVLEVRSHDVPFILDHGQIIGRLVYAKQAVDLAMEGYRYDSAASALYHFAWGEFCDWFLEFAKPIFQSEDETSKAETRAGWRRQNSRAM